LIFVKTGEIVEKPENLFEKWKKKCVLA